MTLVGLQPGLPQERRRTVLARRRLLNEGYATPVPQSVRLCTTPDGGQPCAEVHRPESPGIRSM